MIPRVLSLDIHFESYAWVPHTLIRGLVSQDASSAEMLAYFKNIKTISVLHLHAFKRRMG